MTSTASAAPPEGRSGLHLSGAPASWLVCAVMVAMLTGAIGLLEAHLPARGLAELYLLAVLPAAVLWGLAHAVTVSVASVLAFNFFVTPPAYQWVPGAWGDWFSLAVLAVTAVVVSELAAWSRRQAQEAALLARVATALLEHGAVSDHVERMAAEALGAEEATILLGARPADDAGGEQYPLAVGGRQVGTLVLRRLPRRGSAARRRVLPALASLLAVGLDRARLAREALEAETLRRSDAVKTAILQAVSHDLRTPLMAILTSAGALARRGFVLDDADRADLLGTVLEEAGRLDRLVGNLLDLSRLQAGAAEPRADVVAVDDLVVAALGELAGDADRVQASFASGSPAVRVDPRQLERALVNLVENALKYSPASEPVFVRVAATCSQVLIRVIDHGPGVAAADSERIFAAFHRGLGSAGVRGAGLGLAIAQGFAEANGGRIWLETHAGQGATFVLGLPAWRPEARMVHQ
jgi:two-component system, OmpR family, sensor histidine kinase KdpD